MAMLLDGPPSTIEDLNARDFDVLNIAGAEGVDLSVKLTLAAAEMKVAIENILRAALPSYAEVQRSFPAVKNIAVTPNLKLWHTFMTLRMFYQDLYYSRLNDRYQARMKLYRDEESRALDDVRSSGFGIVFDPIPQALPPGTVVVASSDAGGTMYMAVSYVNSRMEEGMASEPIEVDTPNDTAVDVNLTALSDNGIGWNLYAGTDPTSLALQNTTPLDPLAAVSLAPGRIIPGAKPGCGQTGNFLYPVPRRILRG